MVLVSKVTAPLRASIRPIEVAPVCMVIDVNAKMVPRKLVAVPIVAELPICQNTLQDRAPLVSNTRLLEAVVSVEPAWNTKTAPASPSASKVSVPVSPIEDAELYTPWVKVLPPRSSVIGDGGDSPAATLYAVTRSSFAPWVTLSPA
jgi:hypothetical protein